MIDVWFVTGDLAATARFNAMFWEIAVSGRLLLYDSLNKMVAAFDAGVWQYVCLVENEIMPEPAPYTPKRVSNRP